MKIAIHDRPGSFSDRWIAYCEEKNIPYKKVNCYSNDIIQQIHDCDALMFHHNQAIIKEVIFAKQLLFALKDSGIKLFPDFYTNWHFDDKVGQKYLFESLELPLVPSYVFYDKKTALDWIEKVEFPKVFKLRGGAGSTNVKLIKTKKDAVKIINLAFGKGIKTFDGLGYILDKWGKYQQGIVGFKAVIKAFGRMMISTKHAKFSPREKGYVYFQDFIPNNDFDIRVIVIDNKAFAIKRMVRRNDFRASGSGDILYEKEHFKDEVIKLAFEVTKKMKSQSCVLDFVFASNGTPMVVEVSYCFSQKGYEPCVGYWDEELNFYEGKFDPYGWMVEAIIKKLKHD